MKNSLIGLFLKETFGRFMSKSPKYFRVWQIILGGLFAITLIPTFINASPLADNMKAMFNGSIGSYIQWITFAGNIMLQLTTQSGLSVDKTGDIVKTTDATVLPFTAVNEQKIINN
jgi:hypothetical protein